jgi:hypothetical protein
MAASVSEVRGPNGSVSAPAWTSHQPKMAEISMAYFAWITSILRNQRGTNAARKSSFQPDASTMIEVFR